MKLIDHYKGCLVGLAVGDSLGTALEFKRIKGDVVAESTY